MADPSAPVILWFRNDLRLADHAALNAALGSGRAVLPVYILDEAGPWAPGGASRWWLHHSLASLAASLHARGAALILRRGDAREQIPRLVRETAATTVYTGGSAEPAARATDRDVAAALGPVPLHRKRTMMLFNPETLRSGAGTPYSVYTPFSRACLALGDPPPGAPAPDHIPCPATLPASDALNDWDLLPRGPDWAGGLRAAWTPGEAGANEGLRRFVRGALEGYAARRDIPGEVTTSRLSPHLHFGEMSLATAWNAAREAETAGTAKFIQELLWREFSIHLLWHNPTLPEQPLRGEFAAMPWREDAGALDAWQRGRTGIPIVDAGMRELWQTGWMHNRVRMVVASFLVKHLLIPWQQGEAWFWDTLVDADLAANAASWQWVAGCGADAAPYFRVFNPVLQGKKFDPDGTYVRRFVPELKRLDAAHIHAPWEAPEGALAAAGIRLGHSYPRPIRDLALGRQEALAAYGRMREPG